MLTKTSIRSSATKLLEGFRARREALQRVLQCRLLVLERRRRLAVDEGLQGTDAECAFFLADLVEVEEEVATGVFRSSRRHRHLASAKYAARNWRPGDPLLQAFADVEAHYRRC